MNAGTEWVVYIWTDALGIPRYVGSGTRARAYHHLTSGTGCRRHVNPRVWLMLKKRVAAGEQPDPVFIACDSEAEAELTERSWIAFLGRECRATGPLWNIMNSRRPKAGKSNKGRKQSPEHKAKRGAAISRYYAEKRSVTPEGHLHPERMEVASYTSL